MFIWLYRAVFIPAFIFVFPFYLPTIYRRGSYLKNLQHRFGYYPLFEKIPGRKRVWIQVVSVGEAQAAFAVIEALHRSERCQIFVTTTTTTAFSLLSQKLHNKPYVWIGFFPFDFVVFSRRAWCRIQPEWVLLFESELWPEHLHQARRHHVPVWLLNARFSDKTLRRYCQFPAVAVWLYGFLDKILFVSAQQMQNLAHIGINAHRCVVAGQLKFDVSIPILSTHAVADLRRNMGFTCIHDSTYYLLGASTWEGEETILLDALLGLRQSGLDARLILVPRHPERGDSILNQVRQYHLSWSRRSNGESTGPDVLVHVADTIGEIQSLGQCATLALVGKSFAPHHGGQTPLELAHCGIPLLYGPNMSNFREVCSDLEGRGLAIQCQNAQDAMTTIQRLIDNPQILQANSTALQQWSRNNQGALSTTMQAIQDFLNEALA